MNEQQRENWLSLLGQTKIDKRHYDKVLSYLEIYMVNLNLYGSRVDPETKEPYEELDEKIIPLTLKIFSMIDLDKVELVGYPMDLDTWKIEVSSMGSVDDDIVSKLVPSINDPLNNGYKLKVFKIIQSITKVDDKVEVYSRMKLIN